MFISKLDKTQNVHLENFTDIKIQIGAHVKSKLNIGSL